MRIRATGILVVTILCMVYAANDPSIANLHANIKLPTFEARLGIGFNYDLLRDPLDVSFEYPRGYFGFNLPLEKSVNIRDYTGYLSPAMDTIFADSTIFTNGDEFRPTAGARQNPNVTIQVDVPMMGGVASFGNTQNFYLNYENHLGNPNVFINPDSLPADMQFLLRGTVNMPVSLTASWESMMFGYAYRLNRFFTFALNIHRHLFTVDMRGHTDIDLLGYYKISLGEAGGVELPAIEGEMDYPIGGEAYGHYESEVWTPTLALKAWRFSVVSRFGIDARAKGKFNAKYKVPFFVNPETGAIKYDFNDPAVLNDPDLKQGLLTNATDSVVYSTNNDLEWKMPTGVTFSFDIIPEVIKISYSKLFGEVAMRLDHIGKQQIALETATGRKNSNDSIVIDYGISIDNIITLQVNLLNSFLNVGVFGMDLRYADQSNLLGSAIPTIHMGDAAMLPILSAGTALGTKLQLKLELDILPLPAVKTGIYYYF